jgi:uncharacterized protein with NAD-binding domain and iron-sulfur cluster
VKTLPPDSPRRLVILGGGIAGLATAWHVTSDPRWRERFASVTLHQMGWRLGGKCATGRGPHGRVEEHGIHLFGGGYYNALPWMREVDRELYGDGFGDRRFDEQFERQYTSIDVHGTQKDASRLPPSPLTLDNRPAVANVVSWLADALRGLRSRVAPIPEVPALKASIGWLQSLSATASGPALALRGRVEAWMQAIEAVETELRSGRVDDAQQALDRLDTIFGGGPGGVSVQGQGWAGDARELGVREHRWLRRTRERLQLGNFVWAFARGVLKDIVRGGRSFASLDDVPYADWLRRHGAWAQTLEHDVVLAPLRILYQFEGGDATNPANRSMGAGGFVHWTLRNGAYLEAPFWFFREGTGESVIRPLYLALVRRGVAFEFFSKVEALVPGAGSGEIEAIELRRQARVIGDGPYEPLQERRWPARARHEQLVEGDEIAALPAGELESYASKWAEAERHTLRRGEHFDDVVLAISLGALPFVAQRLIEAEPAWQRMVEHVKTVETQSLQVWFDTSSEGLGIADQIDEPVRPDDTGLGAGLATPFDGFSDFTPLIFEEDWSERPGAPRPRSLWYFADVLKTPSDIADPGGPGYAARRHAEVLAACRKFLETELPRLLPRLRTPGGFDWDRLVPLDAAAPAHGPDRLGDQWVRANVEPPERYVQALAGTTRFRLEAGRSAHWRNLYLAGDWTHNGLDVGCVEATVMSGMLAANDLLGRPHSLGVVAYFPPAG